MRTFRSREMKGLALACLLLTAALTGLGFWQGKRFGCFALGVCGVVSAACLTGYGLHLRRLEKLTLSMQRVLRGEGALPLSQNREGEYAIFEHELYKLSQALRTQIEEGLADKRQLADALADISHQIKTPLTAMTLECQLLRAPEMEAVQRSVG